MNNDMSNEQNVKLPELPDDFIHKLNTLEQLGLLDAVQAYARAAIALNATGDDDAALECTCAAKDMPFGRCCKLTPNKCKWCGHDIHAHDKQYGCAEDGCDCETPNAELCGGPSGPSERAPG